MPAKSAKQFKLMAMIAHGGKMTNKAKSAIGPSEAVAKEFVSKTSPKKRSEFMKGFGKKGKDKKGKK